MKNILTILITLVTFATTFAQSEHTRFQMVSAAGISSIVEAFNFEREGVSCNVEDDLNLGTSNAIAIEITASSNEVPYRIVQALMKEGIFDLATDEMEGNLIIDIKHKIHKVKVEKEFGQIDIAYKIFMPEHIGYKKAGKDGQLSTQAIASNR